jgi:quinol monooxygenase YgiN
MIAWRNTWPIKPGKMEEALEALKETIEATDRSLNAGGVARAYVPFDDANELIFEEVWPDEASQAAFWEGYNASAEAARFWDKWGELVAGPNTTVMWHVTEWR